MMDFGYVGYSPFMGFGFVFMILFWGVVLLGFIALVKFLSGGNGSVQPKNGEGKSATEILKERYAKGEIDKNEFDAKMKDLKD